MQDSEIVFKFEAKGADEVRAQAEKLNVTLDKLTRKTNGMYAGSGKLTSAQDQLAGSTGRVAGQTDRASRSQSNYFGHIAKTTVQSAIINKGFLELVDVMGQAIEQVDLMNNFPATMASMGQSTEASGEAFKELNRYVGQTGANLGQAVSMVTRFTGVTNNVKAATAIYEGLNNALVAGDTTLEEQKNAATQFAQALERGKPDMKEWNTLTTVMSQQLGLVAESMGYVSANALGQALRNGEESMGTFTAKLTEMSTGTGPIAVQAMARMNGIQFAFNVMKNALTQGVAQIVNAFGRSNIVGFFNFMTEVIQVLTAAVITAINWIIALINTISGLFGGGQIAQVAGDAGTIAQNLGDGAGAAEDLKDGLGDAGKEAKKLNKSLASFDKMNVLPDKESGSGGGKDKAGGGGGAGFNPSEISGLEGLFDGLQGKLKEASTAAKIFAGILAGIAGIKLAQGLLNQFNGLARTIEETGKNVDKLKKKLNGADSEVSLFQKIKDQAKSLPVVVGGSFSQMGKSAQTFGKFLLTPVGSIAAIGVAIGLLYVTNEEFRNGFNSVWEPIIGVLAKAGEMIGVVLVEAFKGLLGWVESLGINVSAIFPQFKDLDVSQMEALGVAAGVLAGIIGGVLTINLLGTIGHFIVLGVQGAAAAAKAGLAWTLQSLKILGVIIATVVGATVQFVMLGVAAVTPAIAAGVAWVVQMAKILAMIVVSVVSGAAQFVALGIAAVTSSVTAAVSWAVQMAKMTATLVVSVASGIARFVAMGVAATVQAAVAGAAWVLQAVTMTAAWVVAIGVYIAQTTMAGVRTLAAGAVMLAGWLMGLGPIGLIIAAIAALIAIIVVVIANFENIKRVAQDVFGNIARFASDAWNNIKNIFSGIGKTIGDAIGGAFRSAVNGAIGFLEGRINSIVDLMNTAIGIIDAVTPGSIGRVPRVSLPRMAKGGVVKQATTAMIGEAGAEAVVPLENNTEWTDKVAALLNQAGGGGQPLQLTVQIGEEKIVSKVIELINEKTQMSGRNTILV